MTNSQLYFGLGLPCILVLVNMAINIWNSHASEQRLGARIDKLEKTVQTGFDRVNDHLIGINNSIGEHEGKLSKSPS